MERVKSFLCAFIVVLCMNNADGREYAFQLDESNYIFNDTIGFVFKLYPEVSTATLISPQLLPDFKGHFNTLKDSVDSNNMRIQTWNTKFVELCRQKLKNLGEESRIYVESRVDFADRAGILLASITELQDSIDKFNNQDCYDSYGDVFFNLHSEIDAVFIRQEEILRMLPELYDKIESYIIPGLNDVILSECRNEAKIFNVDKWIPYFDRFNEMSAVCQQLMEVNDTAGLIREKAILEDFLNEVRFYFSNTITIAYPHANCDWWEEYLELSDVREFEELATFKHVIAVTGLAVERTARAVETLPARIIDYIEGNNGELTIPEKIGYNGQLSYEVTKLKGPIFDSELMEKTDEISIMIPSGIDSICGMAFPDNKITEVHVSAYTPPFLDENAFSEKVYKNAILYVPEIKYQEYVLSDWRRFTNIYFSLSSSIDEISNDNIAVWSKGDTIYIEGIGIVSIYDTLGKLVYKGDSREIPIEQKGIYIVKIGSTNFKIKI